MPHIDFERGRLRSFATVFLVVVVCVTAAASAQSGTHAYRYDVEVGSDGTIEEYEVDIVVSSDEYSDLKSSAQMVGHDGVCGYLTSEVNESTYGSSSCDVDTGGTNATITLTLNNYEPRNDSGIHVGVTDNGTVTYRENLDSTSMTLRNTRLTYTVQMPGGVTETNGEVGDDNRTVVWKSGPNEPAPDVVWVRSEQGGPLTGLLDFDLQTVGFFAAIVLSGAYVAVLRSDEYDFFSIDRDGERRETSGEE